MERRKKWIVVVLCGAVVVLATAFSRPKGYEYRIINGRPDAVEGQLNQMVRDGWEPKDFAAGGAIPVSGEMNSATQHGARVYVLLQRKR